MTDAETFIVIVMLALVVISQIAMWWCRNNVYLTYKEQRSWEGEK